MAGNFGLKFDPKNNPKKNGFSSEFIKDSNHAPQEKPKFSLKGVLGLGQTVEIGKTQPEKVKTWNPEFFGNSILSNEQKYIFDSKQRELQQGIEELRQEIQKLIKTTEHLDNDIEKIAVNEIVEPSEYQLSYLQRIKTFIINFTKDISQAGIWMDSLMGRKKKRNAFWNNVKNKKNGGEQYLMSSEHSASRSAA